MSPSTTTTGVIPAKLRYYSDAMQVDVVTVYGYRGRCKCGWQGTARATYSRAYSELRTHKAEEHREAA